MGLLSNRVERGSLKPGDHIYSWRSASMNIYAHHGIYVGDDRVINFTRHGQEVRRGSVLDVFAGSSAPTHVPCDTCAPSEGGHGVLSSCLDCFLAGGTLYRFEYAVSPAFFIAKARGGTCTCAVSGPDDDVVKRAKRLLDIGFGRYDVVTNNCEDFAIYCKTGLCMIDRSTKGQSGQAQNASIIRSIVGSSVATNAAANVCGRAATAIGKFGFSSARMGTVFGRASTAIGKIGVISGSMATAYLGAATVIVDLSVYSARRYAADIGVRKDVVRVPVDELISYKEALEFIQSAKLMS